MQKTTRLLALSLLFYVITGAKAQDAAGYQQPPAALSALLLAKPTPAVSINSKASWMLLSERNSYPSVEELAQPEIRVAGLRINPANFSLSRQPFINNFRLQHIKSGKTYPVTGLPAALLAGNIGWSPDEKKIAFTHTTNNRVDLYVIDVESQKAVRINKQPLNIVLGNAYTWLNNNTLLYKIIVQPAAAAPARPLLPTGPSIQQNLGKASPSRTYQDLIKSPYDEQLFTFYATAQLARNSGGVETPVGTAAAYQSFSLSPDKQYMLVKTLQQPYSYLVPVTGFPMEVSIQTPAAQPVKVLAQLPSAETSPSGFDNVQQKPRAFDWRDDTPATITWCEPLDSGLIKNKVPFRDAVYALPAPFTGQPVSLFKTPTRFRSITWGNNTLALVEEGLQGKQLVITSRFNPATGELVKLVERNSTDAYNNPGTPVTTKNSFDKEVLLTVDNGSKLLLNNITGSSPKGDLPFLAKFDLQSKQSEIVWRCAEGSFEYVSDVPDPEKLVLLTRKETPAEAPNYYLKNVVLRIADRQITHFTDPYPQLQGISRQKLIYKRADGVDLTGDLYLPKGYNATTDGPLPVLIWAYPKEYNAATDAAQIRGSQYRFTTISWASPVYWVTQGYAVLDNAEMPIAGKNAQTKPNDTFIEQLKMNAQAAIDKLAAMGVGDKNRVAVGGHSYGAFMTASLLAHTQLFKAGIARSGAYNRTLTPFGFQNEERTYWQAPELYYNMSPFSFADKIKTPLLMIHGDSDDNPGTFPIQSERLFNAIKGSGGTVRFVSLPYEAHSYRGKENLLHMLWEMNQWLDKYVKQAK
jgi:dipeptidyl aminopeptidase/acylaminoacyl peptidase